VAAGACWGAYSIVGRRSRDPLSDTSRNFVRATAVLVLPLGLLAWPARGTLSGVALATASGALASGVGYTVWYAVLPSLSSMRAATIQLAVPIVTVAAAWVLLGESITMRLIASAIFVAAGVWLTTSRPHREDDRLEAAHVERTGVLAKLDALLPAGTLAPGDRDRLIEAEPSAWSRRFTGRSAACRRRFLRLTGDDPLSDALRRAPARAATAAFTTTRRRNRAEIRKISKRIHRCLLHQQLVWNLESRAFAGLSGKYASVQKSIFFAIRTRILR
jgi:uncharacterized membrane protein